MNINNDILKKAQKINQENFKKRQYLYDCYQAKICPKCGSEKVTSKTTSGGFFDSTIYTCKNCGRIYY